MSNFKSGSGNLDFGGDDDESDEGETADEEADSRSERDQSESSSRGQTTSDSSNQGSTQPERPASERTSDRTSEAESARSSSPTQEYPYFVRRSNVGDERDTRLEIHVRDRVADQEAEFRSDLAEQLDTSEVSKTDAREFALLAAFHHPERVAELMRDEGFGELD
ncbi:acyl-CoA dehydrogenase [Halosimplex sp. TS25]|uniref:acyl-CoA dehydrogenase n=1 Tax=Halosimplex rarum TaxID=3396619 RepID=UPI0039EB77C8